MVENRLKVLNEIGKALTSTITINEVFEKILDKMVEIFDPENWSLFLVDEEKDELYFKIVVGEVSDYIKNIRLKIGEGIAGRVAKTGKALYIPDVKKSQFFSEKTDNESRFNTRSVICIPLRIRNKTLGVIELINMENVEDLTKHDKITLSTIADYAAIALENARNFEKIKQLLIKDDLTDLYNSKHLHTVLEQGIKKALKSESCLSIIFLDLDSFKNINDTLGHLIGSRLLTEIGKFIKNRLRENFSAARYGGDEFVIILEDTCKKSAVEFCEKIHNELSSSVFFSKDNLNIKMTASFGIATFPEDADSKERLLYIADKRMYTVKNNNKNGISYK